MVVMLSKAEKPRNSTEVVNWPIDQRSLQGLKSKEGSGQLRWWPKDAMPRNQPLSNDLQADFREPQRATSLDPAQLRTSAAFGIASHPLSDKTRL
jgi:hypothetical protein